MHPQQADRYRDAYHAAQAEIERLTARLAEATTLLRAIAPESPINQDELGGCVWCGKPVGKLGYDYATADPKDHHDDCAWLRSRAWLAVTDPANRIGEGAEE